MSRPLLPALLASMRRDLVLFLWMCGIVAALCAASAVWSVIRTAAQ